MNKVMLFLAACVLLVSPDLIWSAKDFSRYDVILQRRPFGAPVEEPVAAPVVDEPPPFVNDLRMVAITESPAGVRVGFLNAQHRPPRTYFLYVGETEDGLLLADADFDGERALVAKDGAQYWMRMGAVAASQEAAAPERRSRRAPASRADRPAARPGVMRPAEASGPAESADSYAERRRQRLEEMRRRAEASRQLSEEEIERQLREYQMRLIREGRTPLPIPITEEMDAQLVAEGILPPVE